MKSNIDDKTNLIKEKKQTKNIKDLEVEYPKLINKNNKLFKEAIFEATEIKSIDKYLDNFYIAGPE